MKVKRRRALLLLALLFASACLLLLLQQWRDQQVTVQAALQLEESAGLKVLAELQNRLVEVNSSSSSLSSTSEKEPTASSQQGSVLSAETKNTVHPRSEEQIVPLTISIQASQQLSSNSQKSLPQQSQVNVYKGSRNLSADRSQQVVANVPLGNSVIFQRSLQRQDTKVESGVRHSSVAMTPDVGRFAIWPEFHFPQPRAVKPVAEMAWADWMKDLRSTLSRFNTHQVTMVTSNQPYRDVLLNWLISATVNARLPLETILIISMDRPVHSLLTDRGLQSVLVTPDTLLTQQVQGMGTFNQVMMTRLAIIRLLNHWGYDVANYDTDAILLRDPQPVFGSHSGSDIIGTFGKFPTPLYKAWKAALCTAVLVVRSSVQTERYWEATSRAFPGSYSDQERMNYGLRALKVQWKLANPATSIVTGQCDNGLRVTLLPYSFACRSNCRRSERGSYYVWHKGGPRDGDSKRRNAQVGEVWLLKGEGLGAACKGEMGEAWLKCLAGLS